MAKQYLPDDCIPLQRFLSDRVRGSQANAHRSSWALFYLSEHGETFHNAVSQAVKESKNKNFTFSVTDLYDITGHPHEVLESVVAHLARAGQVVQKVMPHTGQRVYERTNTYRSNHTIPHVALRTISLLHFDAWELAKYHRTAAAATFLLMHTGKVEAFLAEILDEVGYVTPKLLAEKAHGILFYEADVAQNILEHLYSYKRLALGTLESGDTVFVSLDSPIAHKAF